MPMERGCIVEGGLKVNKDELRDLCEHFSCILVNCRDINVTVK